MLENCCIDRKRTTILTVLNETAKESSREQLYRKLSEGVLTESQVLREFAMINSKKWNNSTINVKFMDGDLYWRSIVKRVSKQWEQYANIKLNYVFDFEEADIRISFSQPGSWSYIGNDALGIDVREPTINFGWFTIGIPRKIIEGTILHEFGHALGLIHEHQSPAANILWNKPRIYTELAGPPNFWDKATVDRNLFEVYSETITNSIFDEDSIMIYFFPAEWTLDGYSVAERTKLSRIDREYIGYMYP